MSRLARNNWLSSRGFGARHSVGRGDPRCRRLRFEPLEDRHLLATITVDTLIDLIGSDGLTTLREAITAAASGDVINFLPALTSGGPVTISLTTAGDDHLTINKNLTIEGPGANLLTIKAFDPDANGNNDGDGRRVFVVDNVSSSLLNVSISGLTLTNGDPTEGENTGGGAILNRENLTVSSCLITGNFATNGGAIHSVPGSSGVLTITDCTITGNSADADGGGLLVEGGGVSVTRTTISNNQSNNSGGGVISRGRPVTILDSIISGNSADERGGGLYQYQGSLTVTGSTISGNMSDANDDGVGSGGGIYNSGGNLTINSTTISGNSSGEHGGGIFSDTGQTITISHSTITANSMPSGSGHDGGGIHSTETANLNHTIVAGNFEGVSTREDVFGSFNASFSLIGDLRSASVTNVGGTSLIGTTALSINALLGPLADNGGLTMTHALLAGSPALDAGSATAMPGISGIPQYDQRGAPFGRVQDGDNSGGMSGARIDMGAFELPPPPPPGPALPGDYNLNSVVDTADYLVWRKTFGTGVTQYSGADGNGDMTIDQDDHGVWRANFGNSLPGSGGGASDETSTATPSDAPLDSQPADSGTPPRARTSPLQATAPPSSLELLLALESLYASDGKRGDGDLYQLRGDLPEDFSSMLDEAIIESSRELDVAWRGA